jgi:hypothetical protein
VPTAPEQETTVPTAPEAAMPRRAYSYRRVSSTGRQVRGHGLTRQANTADEISKRKGWCLDDTVVLDDKGLSGYHEENFGPKSALARFTRLIERGRVTAGSVLILDELSRFSRAKPMRAVKVLAGIIDLGVSVYDALDDQEYSAHTVEDDPFALLKLVIKFQQYHEESKRKSRYALTRWEDRRKGCRAGKATHGKRCREWLEHTGGGYVLRPGPAHSVRTIFRLAREGLGVHRIAAWLNARPGEHPPLGKAGTWLRPYVRQILRGRAVLGEYQPRKGRGGRNMAVDGEPIKGYYPVVIGEEEWRLAQAALDGRRRKGGRPGRREANLFTGIVYEATSRKPMSVDGRSSGAPGKVYRYLVAYQKGAGCRRGRGLPYRQFEEGVLRAVGALRPRDVLPADAVADEREAQIAALTARLVALDHRAGEVQRQIEDPDNAAAVALLTKSLSRLLGEKAQAAGQLEALKVESLTGRGESLGEAQSLLGLLRGAEGTPGEEDLRRRLKAALRWVVEEIWVVSQPVGEREYVGHAQIYLRGGSRRYVQLLPRDPRPGLRPWDLSGRDFRAGDVGDVARHPEAKAQSVG